jgi:hypothetical protein
MKSPVAIIVLGCALSFSGTAKLPREQLQKLPPPASHQVDFSREIKPILEASCLKCHGRGRSKGDFRIDTRETLLKGGESGPAVVLGQSLESSLIEMVSGLDPDSVMPKKGSRLTPEQVGVLRAWIDQGLPWNSEISFAKPEPQNLKRRQPPIPTAAKGLSNPVDAFLAVYFQANKIRPEKPVNDRVFARRVYLDVIGLLPPPSELEKLVNDKNADKRSQLVRSLLQRNEPYAGHWLSFWNDMLRNDYRGTGYIDGGRKQITPWLYAALANNLPYDKFVAQLVHPTPESEGFVKGIVWRGVVNASQTPPMQAAQNISQVFMGVNLKCASCHDSFINDWQLADAYGLANIYSDDPLEMFLCDKPTGKMAPLKFIYSELGTIPATTNRQERLAALANLLISPQDGRLSRTIVNRLWARFFGRGLVESLDDMEQPAWNPDLLDWLAEDLIANHYDLKKTMERILTSQAYQLPAINATEQNLKGVAFRGPVVRRMSSEQLVDGLSEVTGVWRALPANTEIDFNSGQNQSGDRTRNSPPQAQWIWRPVARDETNQSKSIYFRKAFDLPRLPDQAVATVSAQSAFTIYLNEKKVLSGTGDAKVQVVDLRPFLAAGHNVLAVDALTRSRTQKPDDKTALSPGFILHARARAESPATAQKIFDFATDATWKWAAVDIAGWRKVAFDDASWEHVLLLGEPGTAPWNAGPKFAASQALAARQGKIRAALVESDALMSALGRPNREQVMTTRASAATTLQALELTNGSTLMKLLQRGAEKILKETPGSPAGLISEIYERALSRRPTTKELRDAEDLVGRPVQQSGVEDLLWAVAMLPEFQLIY